MVSYKELAERYERDFESIKKRSIEKYGKIKPLPSLINSGEKAVYYRKMEGNLFKAKRDYREVLRYGSKKSMDKIMQENKKPQLLQNEPKRPESFFNLLDKEFSKLEKIMGLRKNFVFAILSIISLVFALFFISPNITGYSILSINQNNL